MLAAIDYPSSITNSGKWLSIGRLLKCQRIEVAA